jgi:hypothetical protein
MIDTSELIFHRRCDGGASQALSTKITICAVGLSLALGAGEARAAPAAPTHAMAQTASNSGHAIRDLGDLPPPANSDNSAPAPASTSTVDSSDATPIPELPTWAMMLVFFFGLGLAGFKRGRKDRLSPGID